MKAARIKFLEITAAAAMCLLVFMFIFGAPVSAAGKTALSKTSVTLSVGDSEPIKLSNASGKIKWASTNRDVCRYLDGCIVATGEGKAYIVATNKGVDYTCAVIVKGGSGKSSFSQSASAKTLNIKNGDTVKVKVITDFNYFGMSYSDSKILSVSTAASPNYDGFIVSMKGKTKGTTTVTMYNSKDKSEKVTFTVNVGSTSDPAPEIKITKSSKTTSFWSKADDKPSTEGYADEVINQVNKERKARGIPALKKSDALCSDASVRAEELIEKFSHTRPDGSAHYTAISIPYGFSGENIAMGQRTPSEVMDCWMDSDGHRGNILDRNYEYIGVAYDGTSNTWVQIFTSDP